MRKLIAVALGLLVMAGSITSCSGNSKAQKEREDSIRIADSIATAEAARQAAEQARIDSIRQDSIAKANAESASKASAANAKKINRLLQDYATMQKEYRDALKYGMMGVELREIRALRDKVARELKKYENDMTEEQKAKYQKLKKIVK